MDLIDDVVHVEEEFRLREYFTNPLTTTVKEESIFKDSNLAGKDLRKILSKFEEEGLIYKCVESGVVYYISK